ncbi:MAG TPA: ATP-binding protein [Dokdonella sp.]|uniref:ATP-binding protein n=1 Tax=Dokdonella sp. TaxID=2291710 RepID=UPI002D7FEB26|nr:ATP-binding protein [Dokdonella sp.]HET9032760.1 ATP-binding protein [Dokdonella sp.]
MYPDIVEGAIDKSDSGLREILSDQGMLRICIAVPVVLIEAFLYLMSPNSVAERLIVLTMGYCLYVVILQGLVRYRTSLPARNLLVATAVLDPLALSAWLVVTNEFGTLIVGFYLFTILGFGFRTGRPLMHLCQLTSIAGFVLVFLSVPYWQVHPTLFVAMLLPLVAVPMYAGKLILTLRESRQHAERESQAKSELLAKVSHELRTPLTGIISATELLAAEAAQSGVTQRTDTILSLSSELLSEINNLLDEAKFGARAASLDLAPVDLRHQLDLVHEALAATAAKKGIDFSTSLDPAITDRIESDSHQLGRVLMNLGSNAVKFTDRGQAHLGARLLSQTESHYTIRFDVSDSGIGIPESFRQEIFEPFAQLNQGAGRRYGGTGLGLAISRQIVELMGGSLEFESTLGQGSRFWFDVTFARSAAKGSDLEIGSGTQETSAVVPKHILVVEDHETNLMLIRELLETDGHRVTTCSSGMAALDILVDHDFDLLLLDYNLGDMDGVRLLQTYQFGRINPARALFLTADTTQATASRLREFAGSAGVMYKPISLGKLRKAIAHLEETVDANDLPAAEVMLGDAEARRTRPTLAAVVVNPLDRGVIDELKSVSTRPQFFPTLLMEAEQDIFHSGQQIIEAITENRYGAVRDAAHALKGVSANVGALRLFALASKLMQAPRDEFEREKDRWINDLGESLRDTVAALRNEVKECGLASADPGATSLHHE